MSRNHNWLYWTTAVFGIVLLAGLPVLGATLSGIKRPYPGETVEVLVQYATRPTAEHQRRVTDRNGRIRATFQHVSLAHYELTP
jgi:hypothetical protein